ncbi:UNVERIFIED_CONTAM: solute carrier family 25 protein, partial [Bacteroidetes bacterium 56_B9]
PVALTLNTVRQHGLRGLWLGQTGTFLRETGGSSAWFTTYEVVAKFFLSRRQAAVDRLGARTGERTKSLTKGDLKTYELMLSGASAGIMYN